MKSERDKLIDIIDREFVGDRTMARDIADFILADRKRIVEPLVKYKSEHKTGWGNFDTDDVIDETLKRAGAE